MSERVGPSPLEKRIADLGVVPLVATQETISRMHPEMRNLTTRLVRSPYFVPMLGPYDRRLNHLGSSDTSHLASDMFEYLALLRLQDVYKNHPSITFLGPQDINTIYSSKPFFKQLSKMDIMWVTSSPEKTTIAGLAEAKLSDKEYHRKDDWTPGSRIMKQMRKAEADIRGDQKKIRAAISQHIEKTHPHLSPNLIVPPIIDKRIIVPAGSPIRLREAIYLPTSHEEITHLGQAILYDLAA